MHQEQLGVQYIGKVEQSGIEWPTFCLADDLLYLLTNSLTQDEL